MSVWNSVFVDFIIGQVLILCVCVCVQNYCFSYYRECDATLEISIYFLIITSVIA